MLFNQFIVQVIFGIITHPYVYIRGSKDVEYIRTVPAFTTIFLELIFFEISREITFYYMHRLLHHRKFYEKYHKQHHQWISPISISAQYCHPVEHITTNVFPTVLGPAIMGSHLITVSIWILHTSIRTVNDHSGRKFPFMLYDSERHDFHHLR